MKKPKFPKLYKAIEAGVIGLATGDPTDGTTGYYDVMIPKAAIDRFLKVVKTKAQERRADAIIREALLSVAYEGDKRGLRRALAAQPKLEKLIERQVRLSNKYHKAYYKWRDADEKAKKAEAEARPRYFEFVLNKYSNKKTHPFLIQLFNMSGEHSLALRRDTLIETIAQLQSLLGATAKPTLKAVA